MVTLTAMIIILLYFIVGLLCLIYYQLDDSYYGDLVFYSYLLITAIIISVVAIDISYIYDVVNGLFFKGWE